MWKSNVGELPHPRLLQNRSETSSSGFRFSAEGYGVILVEYFRVTLPSAERGVVWMSSAERFGTGILSISSIWSRMWKPKNVLIRHLHGMPLVVFEVFCCWRRYKAAGMSAGHCQFTTSIKQSMSGTRNIHVGQGLGIYLDDGTPIGNAFVWHCCRRLEA